MSRITVLQANNFMGLEAVHIEPDGNLVIINGDNGQGKSSVLQAIWALLASAAGLKGIDAPVRDGEAMATIQGTITTGDGEGFQITRSWKADSGRMSIKVTNLDGSMNYSSPEGMLKKLFSQLSFDPLAFSNMKPKEQVEFYLRAVAPEFDLDELNVQRAEVFDKRTDANRDLTRLQAQLEGIPEPPEGTPTALVSAAEILAEQQAAQEQIGAAALMRSESVKAGEELQGVDRRVEELQAQLASAEDLQRHLEGKRRSLLEAVKLLPPDPDLSSFADRIAEVERTNELVRQAARRTQMLTEVSGLEVTIACFNGSLDEIDQQKAELISKVPAIVDGLTFDDDKMIYNGHPLKQASGSEQLMTSVMMGIKLNPEVKVMTIQDGPLLDAGNLAMLNGIAEEHGFDIWIERVGTGEVGFTISEGNVVSRPLNGATVECLQASLEADDPDEYGEFADGGTVLEDLAELAEFEVEQAARDAEPEHEFWEDPDAGF